MTPFVNNHEAYNCILQKHTVGMNEMYACLEQPIAVGSCTPKSDDVRGGQHV